MTFEANFHRFPPFSPLILGTIDVDLCEEEEDGSPGALWYKGTGLLHPYTDFGCSHYCASTYNFDFKADLEEVTKIVGYGCSPGGSGMLHVATPALVTLVRYFYYKPHDWNARILYYGLEINVDPGILLPLDTPRDFGWEMFQKAHEAFESPDWHR